MSTTLPPITLDDVTLAKVKSEIAAIVAIVDQLVKDINDMPVPVPAPPPVVAPPPANVVKIGRATGSLKDKAGNTYTLSAAGNCLKNGQTMTGGDNTIAMAYAVSTDAVYGQDATTQNWFVWDGAKFNGPVALPT